MHVCQHKWLQHMPQFEGHMSDIVLHMVWRSMMNQAHIQVNVQGPILKVVYTR